MNKVSVLDVFGVSNDLVKSYIERPKVDGEFLRAIQLNKQVVVYGSSKQGKTSLIKKHLGDKSIIQIECSPKMKLIDIYSSILRQSNIEIISESCNTNEDSISATPTIKAKVKIPFLEIEGGGEETAESIKSKEIKYKTIEYNLSLAQDILEILKNNKFDKTIVLENFHYLEEETQKLFSFDLRTFQDGNIRFVIVGIWRERNRLAQFNGDLQDRMVEVSVEPWEIKDLNSVIEKGAKELNVDFSEIKEDICNSSFDSVGVLQELCKESCISAGILTMSDSNIIIKLSKEHFNFAKKRKLDDYSGRHLRSFESFADSSRKEREGKIPLFIPYYFLKFLLSIDFKKIPEGIKRKDLHAEIISIHHRPNDVRPGDMSNFLYSVIKYQIMKGIKPPLFDYDRSIQTLSIIDSTLYFFLRECNKEEVLENLPLPSDKILSK
jgi:hypothetical protein